MSITGSAPYLDCNATTPIEPEVQAVMLRFLSEDFGNAGSRTHEYGSIANRAVEHARSQVADVVGATRKDVVFTSGATESNNLAILGLEEFGNTAGKRHIISTGIEHKAVLEPLEQLGRRGFEIKLVTPNAQGRVDAETILQSVRDDTLLVSVMHVNNETGVIQPIAQIADGLADSSVLFHTDAAQGFGKELESLRHPRIDLMSITAHKIYGPKGIGALVMRRRPSGRPRLQPLMYGGGQEMGLRPGTMPVHLAAGFGLAAEIAARDHVIRRERCLAFRREMLEHLEPLCPTVHGAPDHTLPHVLNLSFGDMDSEAVMLALKSEVAISNGSACTSSLYTPSHVLTAMGFTEQEAETATRWSWCHLTPTPRWERIVLLLRGLA